MRLAPTLLALSALGSTFASAHPGHDHSDIPAVIRHPFASAEHFFAALAVGGLTALLVWTAVRIGRAARKRDAVAR